MAKYYLQADRKFNIFLHSDDHSANALIEPNAHCDKTDNAVKVVTLTNIQTHKITSCIHVHSCMKMSNVNNEQLLKYFILTVANIKTTTHRSLSLHLHER